MIKQILENIVNESTQGTITVKIGDKYYRSIMQADGYLSFVKPLLKKKYNSQKDAERLVQKTGEIRRIDGDEVEYYTDKKVLSIKKADSQEAIDNTKDAHYKYFWDGKNWMYAEGSIGTFADMKKL